MESPPCARDRPQQRGLVSVTPFSGSPAASRTPPPGSPPGLLARLFSSGYETVSQQPLPPRPGAVRSPGQGPPGHLGTGSQSAPRDIREMPAAGKCVQSCKPGRDSVGPSEPSGCHLAIQEKVCVNYFFKGQARLSRERTHLTADPRYLEQEVSPPGLSLFSPGGRTQGTEKPVPGVPTAGPRPHGSGSREASAVVNHPGTSPRVRLTSPFDS